MPSLFQAKSNICVLVTQLLAIELLALKLPTLELLMLELQFIQLMALKLGGKAAAFLTAAVGIIIPNDCVKTTCFKTAKMTDIYNTGNETNDITGFRTVGITGIRAAWTETGKNKTTNIKTVTF